MERSDRNCRRHRPLIGAAVLTLATMPLAPGAAQIATSPPPAGVRTHRMVPGQRYDVGGIKRWLLGSDYRDLWSTAIEAPVLNLDSVGGGLTPSRTGGFGQSVSLHFDARDGRDYVVRSVDKDPTKRLIPDLKDTFVEDIIQDQISALHPTAALVVDPLLDATGILHARHRLVIIPDDPRLGEFRETFAGMLGMLVLNPDEGADDTPGFAGSRRISGTESFLERLERGPCDRVDARAYLKARLVDFIIGDKDRHAGQWRWASFPAGECNVWRPIPEDRDQAFIDFDGFIMWGFRVFRPQQIKFEDHYPSLTGLTFNGWELDRTLLPELERAVWDSLVAVVQAQLPDTVIDAATRRMPQEHYALSGLRVARALKSRRDDLPDFARRYYRLVSHTVDVPGTDQDELAEIEHLNDGDLRVRISLRDAAGATRTTPHFDRTFHPWETREVRIYLHGGDDRAEISGTRAKITVRVIGGGGDDQLVNAARAGAHYARFYDARGDNEFVKGRGAVIDERSYERPPSRDQAHRFALDWGSRALILPSISYSPDVGLFAGAGGSVERYGFRKDPWESRHSVHLGVASNGPQLRAAYSGVFRHIVPSVDGVVRLEASGIEILRFHGFGNQTATAGSSTFYKVEQQQFIFAPGFRVQAGRAATLQFQPVVKLANTDLDANAGRFVTIDPPYGSGSFGQVGVQGELAVDTRDEPGHAKKGVLLEAGGSTYPRGWDVESAFSEVHGALSTYLSAPIPSEPTLALRIGGKKVWGTFPYHEAAYLGGADDLRGFREQRFAGDAAVFGNAELRVFLSRFSVLVPGRVGVFGLADAGRVFYENDDPDADTWHTSFGGGVWLSAVHPRNTLSLAVASGDDLTGLYVRAGFLF